MIDRLADMVQNQILEEENYYLGFDKIKDYFDAQQELESWAVG
jgi:hypothetical protein